MFQTYSPYRESEEEGKEKIWEASKEERKRGVF
jgi:hypothetical protein